MHACVRPCAERNDEKCSTYAYWIHKDVWYGCLRRYMFKSKMYGIICMYVF